MFNAEVVHKGRRKEVNEAQVEWLDADVKEASDLEAPIAVEWRSERGNALHTRWHDGAHWILRMVRNEDTKDEWPLSAAEMETRLAAGDRYNNPLAVGVQHVLEELASGKRKPFDPEDFREVKKSDREAVIAAAENGISGTLIVDGMVYVRHPEPAYQISSRLIRKTPHGPVLVPQVVGAPKQQDHATSIHHFRIDRFDDMEAEARALYGDEVRIAEEARASVYVSEAIRFDDEKEAFLAGVEGVLKSKRAALPREPIPSIKAWAEAAEALAESKKDWRDKSIERLEQSVEALISLWAENDSYYSDSLTNTLNRWRMRPIVAEPAEDPSFKF